MPSALATSKRTWKKFHSTKNKDSHFAMDCLLFLRGNKNSFRGLGSPSESVFSHLVD